MLNSVFLDALEALPDYVDCDASTLERNCGEEFLQYMKFIGTYGTDYINSVNMGAKKIHRLIIKSSVGPPSLFRTSFAHEHTSSPEFDISRLVMLCHSQ